MVYHKKVTIKDLTYLTNMQLLALGLLKCEWSYLPSNIKGLTFSEKYFVSTQLENICFKRKGILICKGIKQNNSRLKTFEGNEKEIKIFKRNLTSIGKSIFDLFQANVKYG